MTEKEMIKEIHTGMTMKVKGKTRFDKIDEMWDWFIVQKATRRTHRLWISLIGATGFILIATKIIEVIT